MRLHVDRQGNGRDLVLVHGWGLHAGVWRGVATELAQRYRVHLVDLPGHGGSHAIPAGSFDDAVAALSHAIPDDAIVCGWSLGAQLAMALAREAPHRVSALALVGATPCFVQRPGWDCAMGAEPFEAFAAGLEREPGATLKGFVRLTALNGMQSRDAIRALDAVLDHGPSPSADTLRTTLGWLRDNDLRAVAPQLRVPAVALHGDVDAVTPIAAGRWLAEHIPGARWVAVPQCAHAPFVTHPAAFVAAIGAAGA